ncbi:MAG TPA: hypothetical protein PLD25_31910, partial [Chloroflexota bacterium]|nr:hypothetical protein [Chloroflexota bacterium]HUM69450.1 hypothetical protein [Chloroflexota bacterium]
QLVHDAYLYHRFCTCIVTVWVSYGILVGRIFISDNSTIQDAVDAGTIARSKVRIGDSRGAALLALSDSWFHSSCQYTDTSLIRDLFFYGSHNPDEVQVVIIRSQKNNGVAIVDFVGTIENYMLHLYDDCVPLPASAFNEP